MPEGAGAEAGAPGVRDLLARYQWRPSRAAEDLGLEEEAKACEENEHAFVDRDVSEGEERSVEGVSEVDGDWSKNGVDRFEEASFLDAQVRSGTAGRPSSLPSSLYAERIVGLDLLQKLPSASPWDATALAVFSSKALRQRIDLLEKEEVLRRVRGMPVHSTSVSMESSRGALRESLVFALSESVKVVDGGAEGVRRLIHRVVGEGDGSEELVQYFLCPSENGMSHAKATTGGYLREKFLNARQNTARSNFFDFDEIEHAASKEDLTISYKGNHASLYAGDSDCDDTSCSSSVSSVSTLDSHRLPTIHARSANTARPNTPPIAFELLPEETNDSDVELELEMPRTRSAADAHQEPSYRKSRKRHHHHHRHQHQHSHHQRSRLRKRPSTKRFRKRQPPKQSFWKWLKGFFSSRKTSHKDLDKPLPKSILKSECKRQCSAKKCERHVQFGKCSIISDTGEVLSCLEVCSSEDNRKENTKVALN